MQMGLENLVKKYVDKDLDEKHNWSIHFLIDIKVVYIISTAYISIVNLISSTANIEATDDKHTDAEFQISSTQRGYVTNISDAVLWNCRPHSVSNYYYKFLYWMLLTGLIVGVSGFFVAKLITLINIEFVSPEYGLKKLWHIAVIQNSKGKSLDESEQDKILKKVKDSCVNHCRRIIPFFTLFFLVAGLFIAYLSYDLHPLACIRGQKDTSIEYYTEENSEVNRTEGRVEINLSRRLRNFQIAAGITITCLAIMICILASFFYRFTRCIIEDMKQSINNSCS